MTLRSNTAQSSTPHGNSLRNWLCIEFAAHWTLRITIILILCSLTFGCAYDESSAIENASTTGASSSGEPAGNIESNEPFCPPSTPGPSAHANVVVMALEDGSFLCEPDGSAPIPAIVYHHGGRGQAIGGDLEGTCIALANSGYLALSSYRPGELTMPAHLQSSLDALDTLRSHPRADTQRIGILGFSRGGLLSLLSSIERANDMHAVALLAPAPGAGRISLEQALSDVNPISSPIALFVSDNDIFQSNHVALNEAIHNALYSAGKEVETTVYGAYCDDGHELFFEVREPYWSDVLEFFSRVL